jgi:hypothetical protein
MNSLSQPLLCCPLCLGKWIDLRTNNDYWTQYGCPNDLSLYYFECKSYGRVSLQKQLTSKIVVNWYSYFHCSVNRGDVNEGNILLDFILPFNITLERLQTLLVFS